MITLVGLKLSGNPDAVVEGKFNIMKDGRKYIMAFFTDTENPFVGTVRRMISEQLDNNGNKFWKVDPTTLTVGKSYKGEIVTCKVAPYNLNGRTQTKWTGVKFAHEDLQTVLKNAGHSAVESLVKETVSEVVEELAS